MDATPWPDVADLLDYWFENPPLHLLVKAYMGYETPDPEDQVEMSPADLAAWAASMNGR